jgi:hypothetical protein
MRDQLGRHLDALKQTKLIKNCEIEKNTKGDGFNLVCTPGEGFFEDYEQFYLKHLEIDKDFRKDEERKKQEQPLRLVEKFYMNLYHGGDLSGMVILDKEIEYAQALLETYSPQEVSDLILYTIDSANRKKLEIRSFGGVKIFLNAWLDEKATRTKRAALKQQQDAAEKDRKLRIAHNEWWRAEVTRLRESIVPEEIEAMKDEISHKLIGEHHNPLTFPVIVRARTDELIAKRYNVPDFEEWVQERKAKAS